MKFIDLGAAPADLTLANDADLDAAVAGLGEVESIALSFPKWTDGRAYSQARLLRVRHHFTGEIRATGEVVVDMVPLLARTGFDAAALREGEDRSVAERALAFFPDGHYQGDVIEPRPHFARTEGA